MEPAGNAGDTHGKTKGTWPVLRETVTRPIARIKIKSAVMVRETGRGQSGRGEKGPKLVVA